LEKSSEFTSSFWRILPPFDAINSTAFLSSPSRARKRTSVGSMLTLEGWDSSTGDFRERPHNFLPELSQLEYRELAPVLQILLQYEQSFEAPRTAESELTTDPQKIRKKGEYTGCLKTQTISTIG
jgi:hypothetical protein